MDSGRTIRLTQQKKSYKTPTLVKYGQLKDLTTGGSGKNFEGGKGEKNKKP